MEYSVKILNQKVIKLLLDLEDLKLIELSKRETTPPTKPTEKRSFIGRIPKEVADDLRRQLEEMK